MYIESYLFLSSSLAGKHCCINLLVDTTCVCCVLMYVYNSILMVLYNIYTVTYLQYGAMFYTVTFSHYCVLFYYSLLINYVHDHTESDVWKGFVYAALMFFAAIVQSMFLHQYFHRCMLVGMRLRAAVIHAVYRKVRAVFILLFGCEAPRCEPRLTYRVPKTSIF